MGFIKKFSAILIIVFKFFIGYLIETAGFLGMIFNNYAETGEIQKLFLYSK